MLPQSESFLIKVPRRLLASRFLTFSLLLHVILVILGGSVVLIPRTADVPDLVGSIEAEAMRIEPPGDPPLSGELRPDAVPPPAPIASSLPIAVVTSAAAAPATLPALLPRPIAPLEARSIPKRVAASSPGARIPKQWDFRTPEKRQMMLDRMNGSKKTEVAVERGLRWLADHQNADGSWSSEFQPSMTGLALLAFLGHGETDTSPNFGPTVHKAVEWLLAKGTEFEGRLSLTEQGWGGNAGVYEHAIATYALAEYFGMTKDARVEPLLARAIGYIVAGQGLHGGWSYGFAKQAFSDTSVTGWQIQALKAAHLTGLALPGVDDALDRAMVNLARMQGPNGGFGYHTPEDRYSLAGVGAFCTYLWKLEKDRVVKNGIEFLLERSEKEFPVSYGDEKADLYAWYYHTQACVSVGGSAWTKWNRLLRDPLVASQSSDGSWPPNAGKSPGGELQRKPDGAGPVYRTALCVLMLESYYRNVLEK